MYTHIYTYRHTRIHIYIQEYINMYIHSRIYTHPYIYIYTHARIHIYMLGYIHTRIHTQVGHSRGKRQTLRTPPLVSLFLQVFFPSIVCLLLFTFCTLPVIAFVVFV